MVRRIALPIFVMIGVVHGLTACLPADARPPPAEIRLVGAAGDDPGGTVTSDGWTITVQRLLVGIGDASLGPPCTRYSESNYLRLLDGTRAGDQKISTLYGLGRCDFEFQVVWPNDTTLLGEGLTDTDLVRMLTTVSAPGDDIGQAGVGVEIAAFATKDSITKHIAWSFRQATSYNSCRAAGTNPQPVEWKSGDEAILRVSLSATSIFAADTGDDAPLAFGPIAAADDQFGDHDGEVTLDEIDAISLTEARHYGRYRVSPSSSVRTLRDYIYLQTLANVARIGEGITCSARLGIRETR
jgi:hypothetical protein